MLLRGDLPDRFRRWSLVLAPFEERPTSPSEWAGAVVLVRDGAVEVECSAGGRRTFRRGDLLVFDGVPVRVLRNPCAAATHLVAVGRDCDDEHLPSADARK